MTKYIPVILALFIVCGSVVEPGLAAPPNAPPEAPGSALFDRRNRLELEETVRAMGGFTPVGNLAPERTPGETPDMSDVVAQRFEFVGNRVFASSVLRDVVSQYVGQRMTPEVLDDVTGAVTDYYVDRGYINAVVLPVLGKAGDAVELHVVESDLTMVQVSGNSWLNTAYITRRLGYRTGDRPVPLNVMDLENRLALLRRNPRIESITATVGPGPRRGESALYVKVREARPYQLSFTLNNYNPPGVGALRGETRLSHINLSGIGDSLAMSYALSEGANEYQLTYTLPVGWRGTTLGVDLEREESTLVVPPFDELDVKSKTVTAGLTVKHPFYRDASHRLLLGIRGDHAYGKTRLLGQPYSFSQNVDYGKSTVNTGRLLAEWTYSSSQRIAAAYTLLSTGAVERRLEPDERFVSWLGQIWFMERLESVGSVLVARADAQVSDNDLPPSEKFSIGGHASVRGYREHQMTTDCGVIASLEWRVALGHLRVPGVNMEPDDGGFQLAFFCDYGKGWMKKGADPTPDEIFSVGIGFLWAVTDRTDFRLYWGKDLRDPEDPPDYDFQDEGVHFEFRTLAF
ncbi:MAG: ShlB/FhaC/HecB family hemolysin secretion/activation protein [Desulfatibacillaceae bacterium]